MFDEFEVRTSEEQALHFLLSTSYSSLLYGLERYPRCQERPSFHSPPFDSVLVEYTHNGVVRPGNDESGLYLSVGEGRFMSYEA